ncbi:cytochrome c [Pseudomonas anguilliseptica]|uniref:Cytochrome c, mono-and diheme variants n=1 Tax=Pseudomonas anguilliseptica TaxID=53406 RepID=A0A1H4RF38_PSEAG|nr:cytochrome c [Pseudomonas anguilliseptica]SEC30532.1 Cytochrome c, mono-and diheme variants [Pseudomonas anguilliseptica]
MKNILIAAALLLPLAAQAADKQLIERGKYLARAADCVACHSVEGGAEYAGGLPLESPFGTIYGTNITPDKQYGIGEYSADDFYRAVAEGERRDGSKLYPAMPYTSYHLLKREDSDAIYAYLMSLEPIAKPSPQTSLSFPFNVRFGLGFWNMLYKNRVQMLPSEGKSETWQRGQYLVEALGHCGECHTPRNALGALQQDQRLQGGVLLGYEAPSLLAEDLAERGWSTDDLATFLKHGISAQGSMFNEMYPVLHHSTQYLPLDDHKAMATYLLGDQPPAPRKVNAVAFKQLDASAQQGRQHYLNLCAGCHGVAGEGVPHVAVAMDGNTTLRLNDARNLLRVIDDGIKEQQFTGFERMQPMPGFSDKLDDGQMRDLLHYLRQTWGGQAAELSPQQVGQLRSEKGH